MALINENYLKLQAGYIFPEIGRRVNEFIEANPDKKVIAPQKWFAPTHPNLGDSDEVTRDLIPEEWERI